MVSRGGQRGRQAPFFVLHCSTKQVRRGCCVFLFHHNQDLPAATRRSATTRNCIVVSSGFSLCVGMIHAGCRFALTCVFLRDTLLALFPTCVKKDEDDDGDYEIKEDEED